MVVNDCCTTTNLRLDYLRFQKGPQNGAGATAVHRRRRGCPHQNAQLPVVRVQPPQSVLLQVEYLNGPTKSSEYHTIASRDFSRRGH